MIEPARFRYKSNKHEASTPCVLSMLIHTCIPGADPALSTVAYHVSRLVLPCMAQFSTAYVLPADINEY